MTSPVLHSIQCTGKFAGHTVRSHGPEFAALNGPRLKPVQSRPFTRALPLSGFGSPLAGIDPAMAHSGKSLDTASNDLAKTAHAAAVRPATLHPMDETTLNRGASRQPFANPFLIWIDLALKIGEMMLASAQVIGHRTGRIAAANTSLNADDLSEFSLMGQEHTSASR